MKDFDADRKAREDKERSFVIGGETFTYRPAVSPESLLSYHRAITGEVTPTEEEWIAVYDETIVALLEPGQDEKWLAVRSANVPHPLNSADINELLQWLLAEQTGRPTGGPSGSSSSSEKNGTSSKDDSSSPGVPVSTSSPSAKPAT